MPRMRRGSLRRMTASQRPQSAASARHLKCWRALQGAPFATEPGCALWRGRSLKQQAKSLPSVCSKLRRRAEASLCCAAAMPLGEASARAVPPSRATGRNNASLQQNSPSG
eukprot:scaffold259638_cov37-Tisochrysis_lutea.AAC.3